MDEVPPVPTAAPESVGETLRAARERQGLSLAEIAGRTRVPLRHLEAIETGNFNGLPSRTYATGFARAYARAVGADEVAITRRLRGEIADSGPRPNEYRPYEAPDPARMPSRGLAIVTLGIALAVIVLAGLWYGGVLRQRGAPTAVAVPSDGAPAPVATTAPTPAAPAAPAGGQVAVETTDRVWLRVHDGARTLYMGTMNPGERFDVPAGAREPLVDVGQPDKLKVTLNGSALPPLPASKRPLRNLSLSPAAVAARQAGQPATAPAPAPAAPPLAATTPPFRPGPRADRPRRARVLDETARANLAAARDQPPGNAR